MHAHAATSDHTPLAPWATAAGKTVCLINPPSVFLLDERVFPSLGLLKVASALEAGDCKVDMLDLSGIENYTDVIIRYFTDTPHCDAVGLTVTTPQLPSAMQILATIRQVRPDLRVILGGPHVTLSYSAQKMERKRGYVGRGHWAVEKLEAAFDVLCSGDGELAIFHALAPNPPKMIDGDDHTGPLFMSDAMYEESPMPARHLIDLPSYRYTIDGHRSTSLIAQLGCPFGCGFCGGRNSKSLRLIRKRSTESVLKEIDFLYKEYGFTGFMFYDDELNVNKGLAGLMNSIADYQEKEGVEFRLRGFVKSELFNDEQAAAMVRAGFQWLLCGFEAADPRILVNIDKRAGVDDNTRAVEIAKRHGLKVKALMFCGHPGESPESIDAISKWLIANQVDDFDCTIITPYPGTAYHDEAKPHDTLKGVWTYTHPRTGDRLHAEEIDYTVTANYYKGVPGSGYKSYVFTDALNAEELVRHRDMLEDNVRKALNIPFNPSRPAMRYEHSMGMGLPEFIYRSTNGETAN
jgi:anaerobic magnesium-protoporphyrin IX monomethyl ester cyclase